MPDHATTGQRVRAYAVHVYTASGIVFAFLAAMELAAPAPDPVWVFLWLIAAVLIDATDGPLARAWEVKRYAPAIDGRKIDDILDFLTFTFLPILLIWRMGWLPEPGLLFVAPPLIASLLGFANANAKLEEDGFFLGFPSYWNIAAFYAGPLAVFVGPWAVAAMLLVLAALTVTPVKFLYPNLAPQPWKPFILWGSYLWMLFGLWMLLGMSYPEVPAWALWASLVYPAFYGVVSVLLDVRSRRR